MSDATNDPAGGGAALKTREDAWRVVCEWTESEALRRHMLGVEAAMRAYTRKLGDDEEAWGIVGLLHDFDYERHPAAPDHPLKGAEVLRVGGWPEPWVRAILGHAHWGGVPRDTPLARTLFAVDGLVGLVFACAYVQPSKSIEDVKASSVKKKLKDKAFARGVNRDDIRMGVEELGVDLDEHVNLIIEALRPMRRSWGSREDSIVLDDAGAAERACAPTCCRPPGSRRSEGTPGRSRAAGRR